MFFSFYIFCFDLRNSSVFGHEELIPSSNFANLDLSPEIQIIDGLSLNQLDFYEKEANNINISFDKSGELFPKINFKNSNGSFANLRDFRGSVVILHFWASWCTPCAQEMVDLNKFEAFLNESEIYGIKIIPISVDDNFSLAKKFYKNYKINNLDLFYDENSLNFNSLKLTSLPHTFIIDKNGRLNSRIDGTLQWTKNSKILNQLKSLL